MVSDFFNIAPNVGGMCCCVFRALCFLVTTRQPRDKALANPQPAIAYTGC